MVELFKIGQNGQLVEIKKDLIADTKLTELKNFVLKNERILGNIALLNNELENSDKRFEYFLGVDVNNLHPVIVELRNVVTGIEAISQIMPYFYYLKSNPDALKFSISSNIKFMKKLEGMKVDLEKLKMGLGEEPKMILIAPAFKKEFLEMINQIKFEIYCIEIIRYRSEEGETILSINKPQIHVPTSSAFQIKGIWEYAPLEMPRREIIEREAPHTERIGYEVPHNIEIPQNLAQSSAVSSRILKHLFKA